MNGAPQKNGSAKSIGTFTDTEYRILRLLADGEAHSREEIHQLLTDEMSRVSSIQAHISRIRGKIKHLGETIVCEINSGIKYRHVRLLRQHTPNEE